MNETDAFHLILKVLLSWFALEALVTILIIYLIVWTIIKKKNR